jgi:hypothetical protein
MKSLWIQIVAAATMAGGGLAAAADAGTEKYAITAEASGKLERAIADVRQAEARRNLWTTVAVALDDARRAAAKGDSAAVIRHASVASEQARLSIEQADYPTVQ